VRWLFVKDIQILRRSPLLVALLAIYPVALAVLIGLALSRGPEKPKVAFLNQVPTGSSTLDLGGERIDASKYSLELFRSIQPVRVSSRREAVEKVRSGEVLGALIIPPDITQKLETGLESPRVEVIYNDEDPLKGQFVDQIINSRLADANLALSGKFKEVAVSDLRLLLDGGDIELFVRTVHILGLRRSEEIVKAALARLPAGAPERKQLQEIQEFARLAIINLNLAV